MPFQPARGNDGITKATMNIPAIAAHKPIVTPFHRASAARSQAIGFSHGLRIRSSQLSWFVSGQSASRMGGIFRSGSVLSGKIRITATTKFRETKAPGSPRNKNAAPTKKKLLLENDPMDFA